MQRCLALRAVVLTLLVARASCFATGATSGTLVSPLQQVVEMLKGMLEKGKEEKQEEEVQYSAYKQWCGMTVGQLTRDVELAGNRIETLQAEMQYRESQLNQQREAIAALEISLAESAEAVQTGQEERDTQRDDYEAIHKQYTDALRVISKAIELVRTQNKSYKQAEVTKLLQTSKLLMSMSKEGKASPALLHVLSTSEQAPEPFEPNAYEFQSDSIIEAMASLQTKFTEERTQQEKEEQTNKETFALVKQDLEFKIAQGNQKKTQHEQDLASHTQILKDATTEEAEAQTSKQADDTYLSKVDSNCANKAELYDQRQERRVEEMESMNQAIAILSSDEVSDHVLQPGAGGSLAALRASVNVHSDPATGEARKRRVAELLKVKAQATRNTELSALAQRVMEDPLEKVRGLINELIIRLQEEATEDATHDEWCKGELKENEEKRVAKEAQVKELAEQAHVKEAEIAESGQELQDLTAEVADIAAAVSHEQEMRVKEKAMNEATVDDSSMAKDAVERAIAVLKEFYEGTSPAQFLQMHERARQEPDMFEDARTSQEPEIFEGAYAGNAGSEHVLSTLDMLRGQFENLISITTAQEEEAAKAHDQYVSASQITMATNNADIQHITALTKTREEELQMIQTDQTGVEVELKAEYKEFETLEKSCKVGETVEERGAQRQDEIESLKEALAILTGPVETVLE